MRGNDEARRREASVQRSRPEVGRSIYIYIHTREMQALWGKPRTLLRLSQRSTELSCTRFDEERSKKSKAIDEQRCGTVFFFCVNTSAHARVRLSYEFRLWVRVCEVHTLADMPGLVIVFDPACACQ